MISVHPSIDISAANKFATGFEAREAATIGELSWLVVSHVWSPIIWKDGRRRQDCFVASDYLALDFDSPEFPLVDAMRSFQGLAHLIGTTRSHRKEKGGVVCDRYRVVVKWSARIESVELYRHNVRAALRMYPDADHACKDGARFFFPCSEIVQLEEDGDTWDVEPLPVVAQTHAAATYRKQVHLSRFAVFCLENVMPLHTRNTACFRLGCEFSRLGVELDDAIARICASPTYANVDMARNRELFMEIEKCVRHGYQAEERKRTAVGAADPNVTER